MTKAVRMAALEAAILMSTSAVAQPLPDAKTATPAAIAAALLDEAQDQKAREALARDASPRATPVVQALLVGMPDRRRGRGVSAHPVDLAGGRRRGPRARRGGAQER